MLAEPQRSVVDDSVHAGSPDAGIGRAAVIGAIIGYFAVLAVVGGIALAAGVRLGGALAVGAYAAMWGGPGWGGMIGAQIHADRLAEQSRQAPH
jgi:hypothetical protein